MDAGTTILPLMLKTFEFVNHTADAAVRAYGRDLRELCENAANGMAALMADVERLPAGEQRQVEVHAWDRTELVLKFLRELHAIHEIDLVLFKRVRVLECDEQHLVAIAEVVPMMENLEAAGSDVKAVTFHNVEIEEEDGLLSVVVVFDI